ncbi:hypothetical protein I7X09_11330 [Rhodococcus sp. P-2]|uniref:hypothetical protein n=1 Tax=Rhodococcus sp. P-2 TaxID=2795031 RepID=UPI00190823E0|nr:hypothetical protein [Rhodococcus sp. P-2]QQM24024.1 hypothetical protein I7X09_11330 [Rhodococcus sp. P-2]
MSGPGNAGPTVLRFGENYPTRVPTNAAKNWADSPVAPPEVAKADPAVRISDGGVGWGRFWVSTTMVAPGQDRWWRRARTRWGRRVDPRWHAPLVTQITAPAQ